MKYSFLHHYITSHQQHHTSPKLLNCSLLQLHTQLYHLECLVLFLQSKLSKLAAVAILPHFRLNHPLQSQPTSLAPPSATDPSAQSSSPKIGMMRLPTARNLSLAYLTIPQSQSKPFVQGNSSGEFPLSPTMQASSLTGPYTGRGTASSSAFW